MTAASATAPVGAQPLKGVLLVVLATLAFAVGDVVTKQLAMRHPVSVVIAARYLVNLALLTVFLRHALGGPIWGGRRWLAFTRGICLACASLTMGLALRVMPVGETVAIVYLAPFGVMLLAQPILGERVGLAGWICACLGFLGVLLIVRPGGGLDPLGVAFALTNAAFGTAYHLLTRFLTRTASTSALLFQTAIVGSVFFCVLSIGDLDEIAFTPLDLALTLALGVLSTAGHFCFTAAYREAPASLLAPINYVHLFWAGGLGWVVFGHVPDGVSLVGMGLVCASGAIVALRSYAARAPAP
jgi:drug/metabolite transporter (DMT)-like permease